MYGLNGSPAYKTTIDWHGVATVISLICLVALISLFGFTGGYQKGLKDGYIDGYIARSLEEPPHAHCHGKPNCEVVE